jgi:hypothetical protein
MWWVSFLKVCVKKNWVTLLNSDGSPLEGRSLDAKEKVHQGIVLNFTSHMVCVNCPAESTLARSPSCNSMPLRWKVSCLPLGAFSGVSPKPGFLLLRPQAKRLILLDLDEVIIDARYLLENEEVQAGSKIKMTSHIVSVGDCLLEGDVTPPFAQAASVHHHNLAPSLDFAKGLQFEKNIRSKFGHSINFTEGFRRREFVLVISFGRSKFKLDVHTVSIVLQACFGGVASLFHVKLLRDRTFRFAVASRSVGFQIYNIGKFSDKDFEFFVNLWGEGGPNWKFEKSKYYIEQDLEWTKVKIKKNPRNLLCSKDYLSLIQILVKLVTLLLWRNPILLLINWPFPIPLMLLLSPENLFLAIMCLHLVVRKSRVELWLIKFGSLNCLIGNLAPKLR